LRVEQQHPCGLTGAIHMKLTPLQLPPAVRPSIFNCEVELRLTVVPASA